jgi:enoyl-CoA hydratase
MSPLVQRRDDGPVTWLTLSRPEKLNALTSAMLAALRAHLDVIATDDSVRCVVLAGAGRSFCAGKDLGSVRDGATYDPGEDAAAIDLLETLPQPTVGRIHGHCFTGGLELALACDLLIAADDARLADTHARYGLTPLWGMSVRLPERVGLAQAKTMMFTSVELSGTQAAAIGLVDRSVPLEDLDEAVNELGRAIAAGSPGSIAMMKRLLLAGPLREARSAALEFERSRPFGVPADRVSRLAATERSR